MIKIIISGIVFLIISSLISIETTTETNLEVTADSVNVSLFVPDSLEKKINIKKEVIEQNIQQSLFFDNFSNLDLLMITENYHYYTSLKYKYWYEKNGFSLLNKKHDDLYFFRSYLPFQLYRIEQQNLKFYNMIYDSPVAFTKVFLGIGDEEMNIAYLSFNKGNILNISDLSFSFDFFTQSGYWYETNEKSQNFQIRLAYQKKWGKLLFNSTIIDQNIAKTTLDEYSQEEKEKGSETEFVFNNSIINIGFRSEEVKFENEAENLKQFFLEKELQLASHSFNTKFEFLDFNKKNNQIYSLQHKMDNDKINLKNRIKYINKEEYYLSTDLEIISKYRYGIELFFNKMSQIPSYDLYKESGVGCTFASNTFSTKISIGKIQFTEKKYYSDILLNYNHLYHNFKISFDFWLMYIHQTYEKLPEWQMKNFLEFSYQLHHNNCIKTGFSYYIIDQTHILNNYISIEITKKFEIRMTVENLLDIAEVALPISRRHYFVNLKWLFLN